MKSKVVLIAADDDSLIDLFRLLLEDEVGVCVAEARSVGEVVSQAAAAKPVLIVIDMLMRGGPEVITLLKSKDPSKDTPILAITGFGAGGTRAALAAGADAGLDAPFQVPDFLAIVTRFLPREREAA